MSFLILGLAVFNFGLAGINTYAAVAGQSAINAGVAVFSFGVGILLSLWATRA